MATAERQATTTWEGPLPTGSGQVEMVSSGVGTFPVTWASRTQQPEGRTSPEELLAGSHATCYAMSLAATLGRTATAPTKLTVTATVDFAPREGGGFQVTKSDLEVRGQVDGIDQERFQAIAEQAEAACPISNALRGNVAISVKATLES
jgi:osmotically inducible protein OsmC